MVDQNDEGDEARAGSILRFDMFDDEERSGSRITNCLIIARDDHDGFMFRFDRPDGYGLVNLDRYAIVPIEFMSWRGFISFKYRTLCKTLVWWKAKLIRILDRL